MSTDQVFLEKYSQIIAEEVNVKEVTLIDNQTTFKQTFNPIGRELSDDFGKDTGKIIGAAKSGNAVLNPDGTLTVTQGDDQRTLQSHQFETRVEGLDEETQAAESGVVVGLDFQLTDELIAEGIAREISRFLNQMRKDADYQIDARVQCFFQTQDQQLLDVLASYKDFLQNEALLSDLTAGERSGDATQTFESDEGTIKFTLVNKY